MYSFDVQAFALTTFEKNIYTSTKKTAVWFASSLTVISSYSAKFLQNSFANQLHVQISIARPQYCFTFIHNETNTSFTAINSADVSAWKASLNGWSAWYLALQVSTGFMQKGVSEAWAKAALPPVSQGRWKTMQLFFSHLHLCHYQWQLACEEQAS